MPWEGGRGCEAEGRAGSRESETAGRAGMGLELTLDCIETPERGNGSLKHYSKRFM